MNIAKALKVKKWLVGDIARLQTLIKHNNVSTDGREREFDVMKLAEELRVTTDAMVNVHAAIQRANSPVADRIKFLSELKGHIEFLRGINTQHGVVKEQRGYDGPVCSTTYDAIWRQKDIEAMVVAATNELRNVQDDLDAYNHKTHVYLSDTTMATLTAKRMV